MIHCCFPKVYFNFLSVHLSLILTIFTHNHGLPASRGWFVFEFDALKCVHYESPNPTDEHAVYSCERLADLSQLSLHNNNVQRTWPS